MKMGPVPSVPLKTSSGTQHMNTGPDALNSAESEYGSGKHENGIGHPHYRRKRVRTRKTRKRDPTSSVPLKTCPGAQKMKTGPDALGIAENVPGSAKDDNGTGRPRYRKI
jgi:hypothetical protein